MKDNIAQKLESHGTVTVNANEMFSKDDLLLIGTLESQANYCECALGDTGEECVISVFMVYGDNFPKHIKNQRKIFSEMLLMILNRSKVIDTFKKILGDNVFIRRIQFNKMNNGSFLGVHLDTESNQDYRYVVSLQLSENYSGGKFILHHKDNTRISSETSLHALTISRCDIPHEVEKVTSGCRTTLIYFISDKPSQK